MHAHDKTCAYVRVSAMEVRIQSEMEGRTDRPMFPEDDDPLHYQKVGDADRDDGEHRAHEDKLFASAQRTHASSATTMHLG